MNKTSEARLKAQKKYWKNHRDYYRKLSLNEAKRVRIQRKKYKQALLDIKEYVENNTLYEQDYDYDYEENLVEYPPSDEQAQKDILDIVNKAIGEDNGR